MAQVDTIFVDQGLPHLGFANDLLYIAGAIAPGSFNDITFGNNVTSYIDGGSRRTDRHRRRRQSHHAHRLRLLRRARATT